MEKRVKMMKRLLLLCALLCAGMSSQAVTRPKLVVGIVIDQMRWDYLYTYSDKWGNGGFSRLLNEGFSCGNTMIDYVPTITACGHATVFTGTTPAIHGIAGNSYMLNGKSVSSVDDPNANGVGTADKVGKKSPRNLLTTTIGDELRQSTRYVGKVIGVSLKDRAAVLPAGHSANGAFWFDSKGKRFITSDYYMPNLPKWVSDFNAANATLMAGDMWNAPEGVAATLGLAQAAVDGEGLGADDVTDMLTVSVSTTDASAHEYGIYSSRVDSVYQRLDVELARFFSFLDRKVGKGNYLLFLTADHGGTFSYEFASRNHLPSTAWQSWKTVEPMNNWIKEKLDVGANLVKTTKQFSIYLDREAIDSCGVAMADVKREVKRYLGSLEGVQMVVDIENLDGEVLPAELKERLVKGYRPGRSGEMHVLLNPGGYDGNKAEPGSSHGTWSTADSHIPLVFMGWGVKHGELFRQVAMTDIAATVCAMLHIQMPSGCIGKPIVELLEK